MSAAEREPAAGMQRGVRIVRWVGLAAGPVAAAAMYMLIPDAALDHRGRATAAVAALMAVWWLSEAIPLSATALLPIALFPLLGVLKVGQATAPYASDLIFLFLGGFIVGLAMQRWGLHKRIALITISLVGTKPKRLVAGFMLATAIMSMWVSNTATAVMMMPIGMSVIDLVFSRLGKTFDANMPRDASGPNFAMCLMLGIAYGASIGGIATLIGTPPNLVLAGFVKKTYGQEIAFAQWMRLGVPFVALFLPLAWLYLTTFAFPIRLKAIPGGSDLIRGELAALGPMKRGEWVVFIVFLCAAAAWILRPALARWLGLGDGLTDTGIAIIAALSLFLIPVDLKSRTFTMDWETAERLPWGILILFGGGLSLAKAMQESGVDVAIGRAFAGVGALPDVALIAIIALAVIFLTELTSNTAVTTSLMPVLAAAAVGLDIHPYLLLIPAAIAASCAFMLPVATPPNAIVFSSGYVTLPQMARAGFWLNLIGAALVTLMLWLLGGWLLGEDLSVVPEWAAARLAE